MRELILTMSVTLDGFVAGPNGEIDWVFQGDPDAKAWKVENLWNAGLLVMGGESFRAMAPYWPTSTDVFAPPMNRIPKAVFSKQGSEILRPLLATAEAPVAGASAGMEPAAQRQPGGESWARACVASGDLAADVATLKAVDGKPMFVLGGARFARSLVAAGLIDRFDLLVMPVALGRGLPIFSDLATPRSLELVSSRVFPLGATLLSYRPA